MGGASAGGDRPRLLPPATRYEPVGDLSAAAARLFRWLAWLTALPSFGLLFAGALSGARDVRAPPGTEEGLLVGRFFLCFIAASGIGITALFASAALRCRSRDLSILFGGCWGATAAVYLPSLIRAWPVLMGRQLAPAGVAALSFPFVLVLVSTLVVIRAVRRRRGSRT